jgi:hypothetical protein
MRKVLHVTNYFFPVALPDRNKRPAKAELLHTRFFAWIQRQRRILIGWGYFGFVHLPRDLLRVIFKICGSFCSRAIDWRTKC